MRLEASRALARLAAHDHGVLCTVHPVRGVDAVPVVYTVDGEWLGIPVDRVKPKSAGRLQREHNLAADPRAALLVEHWDRADWTRLWWLRAELRWQPDPDEDRTGALADRLAAAFAQYRDQPFARILVFRTARVTGWQAIDGPRP